MGSDKPLGVLHNEGGQCYRAGVNQAGDGNICVWFFQRVIHNCRIGELRALMLNN